MPTRDRAKSLLATLFIIGFLASCSGGKSGGSAAPPATGSNDGDVSNAGNTTTSTTGNNSGSSSTGGVASASTFTIGGTVSGLSGTVVLQNNASDPLTVTADGPFQFATALANGGAYAVTVSAQPSGQTCTVSNGTGTIAGAVVTNISVVCSALSFTVGGTVSGLADGESITVQNNGADDLSVSQNGSFVFAASVAYGAEYLVTLKTEPSGKTCTASGNSGRMATANVSNIQIACIAWLTPQWARSVDGPLFSSFSGIASDSNGNIYAVGTIASSNISDNNFRFQEGDTIVHGISSKTTNNTVIVKYNPEGHVVWAKSVELGTDTRGPVTSYFNGVALDSQGNVYAVGAVYEANNYTFGNGVNITATGVLDSFNQNTKGIIVKYDSNGVAQWAKSVVTLGEGAHSSGFQGVSTDSSGNVYAAGYITGTNNSTFAEGISVTGISNDANIVIVKYNPSGNAQWARTTVSGANKSSFNGVTVDSAGNAYAVGYISGTNTSFAFSESIVVNAISASEGYESVIVKYSSGGEVQWAKSVASMGLSSVFNGVSADSNNNIYAIGAIHGTRYTIFTYTFADGVSVQSLLGGLSNAVIVKYSPDGNAQWAKSVTGESNGSRFNSVSFDSQGNAFAAGSVKNASSNSFAAGVSVAGAYENGDNTVIVKYNANGDAQAVRSVTSALDKSIFNGVSIGPSGDIYAVGTVNGSNAYKFSNAQPEITASGTYSGSNALIVKYSN